MISFPSFSSRVVLALLPLVLSPALASTAVSLQLDVATLLGGRSDDRAHGLAVDPAGQVYLTAPIRSPDFPTTSDALNSVPTGVYLAQLSPTGALRYSTFLGAAGGANYAHGVAVDAAGCIYIAGNTTNPNFPTTPGAFQTAFKGPRARAHGDAFVIKLNPAGDRVIYATFLGGTGLDNCGKIVVDPEGCVYVVGSTSSRDLPVTDGALQRAFNGGAENSYGELFVAKLSADGSRLVYCTYLGGSGDDNDGQIVVDPAGRACIAWTTTSSDFPTTANAHQRFRSGTADIVLARLTPDGTALDYATYLGGSGDDRARSLSLNLDGILWLAGDTSSDDFPTASEALCAHHRGGTDGFIAQINPDRGALLYGSRFGGSEAESMMLAVHPSGLIILAGRTESPDFPLTEATSRSPSHDQADLFLALFDPVQQTIRYSTLLGGQGTDNPSAVVCQGSRIYVAGNTTSPDFPVTTGVRFKGGSNPWGGDAFAVAFTLSDERAPAQEDLE